MTQNINMYIYIYIYIYMYNDNKGKTNNMMLSWFVAPFNKI